MVRAYAFTKPDNSSKSILIMNVHSSFAVQPPAPTPADPFADEALYEQRWSKIQDHIFHSISTDGDG